MTVLYTFALLSLLLPLTIIQAKARARAQAPVRRTVAPNCVRNACEDEEF